MLYYYIAERQLAILLPLPHSLLGSELCVCRFHSPRHCCDGSLIFRLATQLHPPVLVHSVHITVDLHCSTVVAPDLVVSRETACWECAAGCNRAVLDCSSMTKGWYNGAVCQVSNVLGSLISFCFSHCIGKAVVRFIGWC